MADIVDTLNKWGGLFATAAQTISDLRKDKEALTGELAAAKAELARRSAAAVAAPVAMQAPSKFPRPPRPRKAFGIATNVDREVLQYTAGEIEAYGRRCYDSGVLSTKQAAPGPNEAEEDAWAKYRSGDGPHPTRK